MARSLKPEETMELAGGVGGIRQEPAELAGTFPGDLSGKQRRPFESPLESFNWIFALPSKPSGS